MRLILDYKDATHVRFKCEEGHEFIWNAVRGFFPNCHPISALEFSVTYNEFVSTWDVVFPYANRNGVAFSVSEELREDYIAFKRNQEGNLFEYTPDTLRARLLDAGFVRKLKDFQLENVCRLSRKYQGATFSVPGAGKTTEALAFFYATASMNDGLLVVAPLNAFGAWDDQLAECTGDSRLSFVRLTGGANNVQRLLTENHRFMLTNYELLRNGLSCDHVRRYLSDHPNTYLFLDESHKIKNGNTAQAEAIRTLQCLPKGRLIMSGTPMPQGPRDLITQFQFLFPNKAVDEANVVECFQKVYVRTTSDRLGITPIVYHEKTIELDPIERKLYSAMRKLQFDEARHITPTNDARYLRSLGKCVMRLMAFVSNPALVATQLGAVMPDIQAYLQQRDGQKIDYVCRRARELVAKKKKVLIWSSFVRNVRLISSRLQDLGADYIDGSVKAGDAADVTTREGKIKRFHEYRDQYMVLVANPAAASEGISLHTVCQYAIYLDRSFNAAHFLQSQDRIHRLGMPNGTVPEVELVVCKDTIDELVTERLNSKIDVMAQALRDPAIIPTDPDQLEDDGENDGLDVESTSAGISRTDVESILAHLRACL